MFNHFDWLAPIYEQVIPPPNPERLQTLLNLPAAGRLLDAGAAPGGWHHSYGRWLRA
jgi:hypothetical protein